MSSAPSTPFSHPRPAPAPYSNSTNNNNNDDPESYPTTTSYLTLPHLISLAWITTPFLSLLFTASRLSLSTATATSGVASAKSDLLSSCNAAQSAATVAASLPRYMAEGTNKQIVEAVNGSMLAAKATLIFALQALEGIIEFLIDMYRSTFLCFLELVVRGGLAIIIGAVEEISSFLTSTFSTIRTNIQSDIASANSAIQSAVSAINKVTSIVHVNLSVPQFSIPSLDALSNVTLPTDFTDALIKLNASLPDMSQLKDDLDNIISIPFDTLIADINATFNQLAVFNTSSLPVPAPQTLTFCSQMDTSVLDSLANDIVKLTRLLIILLVLIALIIFGLNAGFQWYKWRCLQQHLRNTREAWAGDTTVYHATITKTTAPSMSMTNHNLLTLFHTSHHPLLSMIANRISAFFHLTPFTTANLHFFLSYIFHPSALACLLIGVAGILSVELQLLAIRPLESHYTTQLNNSVSDFSSQIQTNLNLVMQNQSQSYATSVNGQVTTVQTTINEELFGWVNTTTVALNDTLVAFYADVEQVINATFGGTILFSPAQEFIKCILGTKIEAFENALTFIHDNLKVDLPLVDPNILMLSNASTGEVSNRLSTAAIGTGNGDDQDNGGVVGKLLGEYENALRKELVVFGIFIAIWGFVVLLACFFIGKRILMERKIQRRVRNETGDEFFPNEKRSEYHVYAEGDGSRSFTPLGDASFPSISSNDGGPSRRRVPLSESVATFAKKGKSVLTNVRKRGDMEPVLVPDGEKSRSEESLRRELDEEKEVKGGVMKKIKGMFNFSKREEEEEDWVQEDEPKQSFSHAHMIFAPPPPLLNQKILPNPPYSPSPQLPSHYHQFANADGSTFPPPPIVSRAPSPLPPPPRHHMQNNVSQNQPRMLTPIRIPPPPHPNNAQNPFATPFDDEHASNMRKSQVLNLTPRAY